MPSLRRSGQRWARRVGRRVTREHLRWTVRVRTTVIAGFLAVGIAAWLRGALESLVPGCVVAGASALMNLLAARRVEQWQGIPSMLVWTGIGDAALITLAVAATGGTASPFLLVYVVQVLTTALVVDAALGAVLGGTSIAMLGGVAWWAAPPPGVTLAAPAASDRFVWLASLAVTLLFLVFVGGVLTRRVRKSERALAGTHRRLMRSLRRLTGAHASLQNAYARLARAEAELVETDRAKTLQLLVAGLAHELGNPLTVLTGNVEPLVEAVRAYERALAICGTLVDEAPKLRAVLADAAEARRETPLLLANCAEATSRASLLLGQLRDFGRGGKATVRRPAALAPALVRTLGLVRYRLPPGVTVHESYADLPDVVCVPAEIDQVLTNLLLNAIDALAPGGNLTLALERDAASARIVVRDDGGGIPPDVLPHVFEPFVTTKEAGRGTGLGLAISHAIVVRHGGRIEVATAVGAGATFTVHLPLAAT